MEHKRNRTEYTKAEEDAGIVLLVLMLLSGLIGLINYIIENLK